MNWIKKKNQDYLWVTEFYMMNYDENLYCLTAINKMLICHNMNISGSLNYIEYCILNDNSVSFHLLFHQPAQGLQAVCYNLALCILLLYKIGHWTWWLVKRVCEIILYVAAEVSQCRAINYYNVPLPEFSPICTLYRDRLLSHLSSSCNSCVSILFGTSV